MCCTPDCFDDFASEFLLTNLTEFTLTAPASTVDITVVLAFVVNVCVDPSCSLIVRLVGVLETKLPNTGILGAFRLAVAGVSLFAATPLSVDDDRSLNVNATAIVIIMSPRKIISDKKML
jgi:hypothetical protein